MWGAKPNRLACLTASSAAARACRPGSVSWPRFAWGPPYSGMSRHPTAAWARTQAGVRFGRGQVRSAPPM